VTRDAAIAAAEPDASSSRPAQPAAAGPAVRWLRATVSAVEHLAGGIGTAVLAVGALVAVVTAAALSVAGLGRVTVPATVRVVRAVADRERIRLSRLGADMAEPSATPDDTPAGLRAAAADPVVRREAGWVATHATLGLVLGVLGVGLPLNALRDLTFPLWWRLLSPDLARDWLPFWTVADQWDAWGVGLVGVGWAAAAAALSPAMAWLQALPGRRLLRPLGEDDLTLRIAELTATRAAALDAHLAELRRIERALHDGAQNRLVAVTVLLGAARRAAARRGRAVDVDGAHGLAGEDSVGALIGRAQDAAEQALADLRAVVRSVLPPVLVDRSLPDALAALAATCPVPCRLDADMPSRCAASVEATAYFAVAEALTNVARHSAATRATVTVAVRDGRLHVVVGDDGRGGATEAGGSGLAGIRRRAEAHDGSLVVTSPPGGPTHVALELPCGS
jgi:signal transduction histidine kinase